VIGGCHLIIEEDGTLYPIEIKLTANPSLGSTSAFAVLDKVSGSKRGTGAIVCLYEKPFKIDPSTYVVPVNCL
jgi:hypothetical protein